MNINPKQNPPGAHVCEFRPVYDGVTCEAGGLPISVEWLEHRCAICHRLIEDAYEEDSDA